MPKWPKNAKVFTVGVNHHKTRGYQSSIPKPVMESLGNPSKITFLIKPKRKVEVVAASGKESPEEGDSE